MTSKRLLAVETNFTQVEVCLVVEMSLTILKQPLVVNTTSQVIIYELAT